MLSENQIKEEISIAYIHAMAAILGFSCEKPRVDMASIDVIIKAYGKLSEASTIFSPEIKFQLKASSALEEKDGYFHLPLSIKNYNDLRYRSLTPQLLALLILPKDFTQSVQHTVEELRLRKCAYWINLIGLPEEQNSTTVTIHIPVCNLLTPHELQRLMYSASKEEL